ncbi:unnamed protein product [Sphagnum tenellum]
MRSTCWAAVCVWTLDSLRVRPRKGSCRAVQCGARRKVPCSAAQRRAGLCSAVREGGGGEAMADGSGESSTNMRVDRGTDLYLTRWLNFVSINEWLSVRTVASATFFSWFFSVVSFTLSDLPPISAIPSNQ